LGISYFWDLKKAFGDKLLLGFKKKFVGISYCWDLKKVCWVSYCWDLKNVYGDNLLPGLRLLLGTLLEGLSCPFKF